MVVPHWFSSASAFCQKSLNGFYLVVSEKIEDIYNSSNHPFWKWIKHTHPSMHQKASYSLVKPTITTSEEVCVAVLDPILYNIFSARDQRTLFFHLFLLRYKRIPLNGTFFLWRFCLQSSQIENTVYSAKNALQLHFVWQMNTIDFPIVPFIKIIRI